MNSLATDIKQLIARRLDAASPSEVLAIASQLAGANEPVIPPAPRPAAVSGARFTNLDADLRPTNGADWAAVRDAETGLIWTRRVIDGGRMAWADAMKVAAGVRLGGFDDWRAPTIQEQLSIIDYGRVDPALDPAHFDGEFGWCWTSTPAAGLSGCAWGVHLGYGGSYRYYHDFGGFVRAVRAGQSFGL